MFNFDLGDFTPTCPSEAWDEFLALATLPLLTEEVRIERVRMKDATSRDDRRYIGRNLFELQSALRERFGVDIAKVR